MISIVFQHLIRVFRCPVRYSMLLFPALIISCQSNTFNPCESALTIGNGLSFHPGDGTVVISKPSGREDANGKPQYSLYQVSVLENDSLQFQSLHINSPFTDYHPVFSPEGRFLLFNSTRPKPSADTSSGKTDIWLSRYVDGQFQEPEYLEAINTDFHDSYPTLTDNNTLYFNSDRPGTQGMMDIYRSEYRDGQWSLPEAVAALNSTDSENDLVVDPMERFMIFNRYTSATNEIDLFISLNENGVWSTSQKLDKINRPEVWELTPTLSLDGKTLYLEIEGSVECFVLKDAI